MEFIAGFTENGVPYGTFRSEEENDVLDIKDVFSDIE